jgi:hypothetical protein
MDNQYLHNRYLLKDYNVNEMLHKIILYFNYNIFLVI